MRFIKKLLKWSAIVIAGLAGLFILIGIINDMTKDSEELPASKEQGQPSEIRQVQKGEEKTQSAAQSNPTNIVGFPLPLHWGMPKAEVESVISANGLHLAKRDRKHLQKARYGPGKSYSWAAIKEEHLEFFNQRRFIVIYLDETDRLTGLSLKLLNPDVAVHKAEIINIATMFKKEYGDPINQEQLIKLGGGLGSIVRYAYKVGNQIIFETELMDMKGGRGRDITTYVNLYWDKP